jgi:hypothetical protein
MGEKREEARKHEPGAKAGRLTARSLCRQNQVVKKKSSVDRLSAGPPGER